MADLELSPAVFSILNALIEEKVGLHYGLLDREILREKASARAHEAGFESLLDYYYFLRYDDPSGQELHQLTEMLVVNETYFFREWLPMEVLFENFIAPWCAKGRKVRIWSAACATGEEPLSLAMLLGEKGLLDQVEIVATDISERVLEKARRGHFSRRAIRQVPAPHLVDRYIRAAEDGWSVTPDLINEIRWERCNLLSDAEVARLGTFDVILCRNVLIYFADETVRGVLARLGGALAADGVLAVGVSESLLRYGSTFKGEEHGGAFVYRRSGAP